MPELTPTISDEEAKKIELEKERLKLSQLRNKKEQGKVLTEEEKALFDVLDPKISLIEYDEKGEEIQGLEKQINDIALEIGRCKVKSLSGWDKFVNNVRKFLGRPESEKVTKFNDYDKRRKDKIALEKKVQTLNNARAVMENEYEGAFKQREIDRAEEERLQKLDKLAKDVVRIVKKIDAKNAGKDVPEVSDDEINKQAEILKNKQYFKDAIAELDSENSTVEPENIIHKLADKIVTDEDELQKYMDEAKAMKNLNIDAEQMENLNINEEQKESPKIVKENGLTM